MAEIKDKNWIDAMVRREAQPKATRKETVEEFCKEWGISDATYFYQKSKKENKKKIIEIWLNEAMEGGNEVLKMLREKAQKGDTKAIELYMKFVLELADNLNIKSDVKITPELNEEQKKLLNNLLYDRQTSNGHNDTGNTSGESLHSK